MKLKLLADSDDEEEEEEEETTNPEASYKGMTEESENVVELLKNKQRNSKAEFDIVKDPNLPPSWHVKYTKVKSGQSDYREFLSPDGKRIRSAVKMLEYMRNCQQYTSAEIESVEEYLKNPKVSVEYLKSLEINNC